MTPRRTSGCGTHSSEKMTNSRPAAGVVVSPDGRNVFVAGSGRVEQDRSFDIVVTKIDAATGSQSWRCYYNGPGPTNQNFDGFGMGDAIVVSPDGSRVVVAGFSNSRTGVGMDWVTVSYHAASGAQQWATRQADEYWQYWNPSIVMAPDGSRVYVGGLAAPADSFNSYLPTIAYNTSDGAKAWTARYADGYEYWGGMTLNPDGTRLFVVGAHASWASPGASNSYDFFSVAYRT